METQATTLPERMCDCCGRPFPDPQLRPATAQPRMIVNEH